jgi:hypothetical protein
VTASQSCAAEYEWAAAKKRAVRRLARAWLFPALDRYWREWPLRDGPNPIREVDVLVATHGWWPWLLTLAVILIVAAVVINYLLKRRREV